MHGLGNDFIFIDGRKSPMNQASTLKKAARFLCDRRFGIGADQILVLGKSKKADFRMDIYNADGSQVEMCGNGLRCLARYVKDHQLSNKNEICVETLTGIQVAKILSGSKVMVDMGEPILKAKEIPVKLSGRVINRPIRVDGQEFRATCVSMGNPHCVIFCDDLKKVPIEKHGSMIEKNHLFPKRTNVEFVKVLSDHEIEMRVWERGAGETLACGSGACAAVVASVLNSHCDRKVTVKLRGGDLQIEWRREDGHVSMTGPAEKVFEGVVEI